MVKHRYVAFVLVVLLAMLPLSGCESKEKQSVSGFYFDTFVSITAYGAADGVLEQALTLCGEYEALLSKTVQGSDVYHINHAQGQPVRVDERTIAVLNCAQQVAELSGGVFDITVAPASALWDFTSESPSLPEESALADAAKNIDYTKLVVENDTVVLPKGMMIDLGGIAKGYIADEIAAFCVQRGVKHALLNFGGNVVCIGAKPDQSAWHVGIQDPQNAQGEYLAVLELTQSAAVTSGIYERGFTMDGVRYHHILDTGSGWPVQNELASVTILSASSMLGDALSTACLALGYEKGLELLKKLDDPAQAVFITRTGEIRCTGDAQQKLLPR